MVLDLTSLRKAIAQAEDAIDFATSTRAAGDARAALHLRAGAIQAFEFTYELAFKTLRRWLETIEADPRAVDGMTFDQIVRRGYEVGVLSVEVAGWRAFRRDRGTTSHAYDEPKARAVFEALPAFIAEARFLADAIDERQAVR